jgi:hypothetical protein
MISLFFNNAAQNQPSDTIDGKQHTHPKLAKIQRRSQRKKTQLNRFYPRTKRIFQKQRTLHPKTNNATRQTLLHLLRFSQRQQPKRNKHPAPQRQKRNLQPLRRRSQRLPESPVPTLGSLLVLDNITKGENNYV